MKIYYSSFKNLGGIRPKEFIRQFVINFHFNTWAYFSLGFHIDFGSPNIEIHLPGGFLKVGWVKHCKA